MGVGVGRGEEEQGQKSGSMHLGGTGGVCVCVSVCVCTQHFSGPAIGVPGTLGHILKVPLHPFCPSYPLTPAPVELTQRVPSILPQGPQELLGPCWLRHWSSAG